MNKIIRNYLMDIALFLLLGINIASLAGRQAESSSGASTAHIVSSVLLTLGCLVHIVWHLGWFRAVLTGKVKGKIKLGMNSMVTVMILLAAITGPVVQTSSAMGEFHKAVGSVALLGLFIHSVKHLYWMIFTTKRLIIGSGQKKANWSV